MKAKRVLAILLSLVLLVSAVSVCAPTRVKAAGEPHTDHCICGGTLSAEHTCGTVVWTPVASVEEWNALTETAKAHVYNYTKLQGTEVNIVLTGDVTLENALEVDPGQTVNICLNGHTLTSPTDGSSTYPLAAVYGGSLNICDCTGTGRAVTTRATFVYLYSGSSFSIYGGTVTTSVDRKPQRWGLVYAGGDQFTMDGVFYPAANADFYMYGGTLDASPMTLYTEASSAATVTVGGAVWSFGPGSTVEIHGGTVKGAGITSPAYGSYRAKGGAIAVTNSTAKFIMTGGTIQGGSVENGLGGCVYLAKGVENEISGGIITGGKAALGGAVYQDNGTQPATYEASEIVYPRNFTASLAGDYTGIPAGATDLSDASYVVDSYVYGDRTVRIDTMDLTKDGVAAKVGKKLETFTELLTLHPTPASSAQKSYVILDVSKLDCDRFYSAVGITNAKGRTDGMGVIFSVYGANSADGEYTLLATSGNLHGYESGEFHVDIAGYQFLKLTVNLATDAEDYYSRNASWCNVSVYKADAGVSPYTPSGDGTYVGISDAANGQVQYLSDLTYTGSSNSSGKTATTLDHPYGEAAKKITIGKNDTLFTKGLGVHPSGKTTEAYTIYDVSTLNCDRFYAAVGITNATGKNSTGNGVIFKVYADYGDGAYTLLAESETITGRMSGEFFVDITGARNLKLVIMSATGTISSRGSAWASACVYSHTDTVAGTVMTESERNTTGDFHYSIPDDASHTAQLRIPNADASSIRYLSDLYGTDSNVYSFVTGAGGSEVSAPREFKVNENFSGKCIVFTTPSNAGRREVNSSNSPRTLTVDGKSVTYTRTDIVLGAKGLKFSKGLGFLTSNPKNTSIPPATMIYDLRNLDADYFYAVVGMLGSNNTEANATGGVNPVTYKVYGSKAASYESADAAKDATDFVELASIENINFLYTGEFHVDISGYTYLKLTAQNMGTSHSGSESAWANACVYKQAATTADVTVDWDHKANTRHPESIQVQAYADGTPVADSAVTLTAADGWSHRWNLPKYAAGTLSPIRYTVGAVAPANYTATAKNNVITCAYSGTVAPTDLKMTGGEITDCTAEKGGAFYLAGGVTVALSGNVTVNCAEDLYFDNASGDGGTLVAGGMTSGDTLAVNMAIPGAFAEESNVLNAGQFTSVVAGRVVSVQDGKVCLTNPQAVTVRDGKNQVVGTYSSLSEALAASGGDTQYLQLEDTVKEDISAPGKTVCLNLNGNNLYGSVTVDTLRGMDSSSDRYTAGEGKLFAVVNGTVERTVRASNLKRYLATRNEDGSYSFDRFYVGVKAITVHPYSGEIGFKGIVGGSENVLSALSDTEAYGFIVQAGENTPVTASVGKSEFVTGSAGNTKTLAIENQLQHVNEDPSLVPLVVKANVYIKLADGTTVTSEPYAYTIDQMFRIVDGGFDSISDEAAKAALKALYDQYPVMRDWNLSNIAAYAG